MQQKTGNKTDKQAKQHTVQIQAATQFKYKQQHKGKKENTGLGWQFALQLFPLLFFPLPTHFIPIFTQHTHSAHHIVVPFISLLLCAFACFE